MNFTKALEQHRRLRRTEDALEQRQDRLHDLFRPILCAYLGSDQARGCDMRRVKMTERHVELIYGYSHRGAESQDYSVIFSRDICEMPNPESAAAALKRIEDHNREEAHRTERIASIRRELRQLEGA